MKKIFFLAIFLIISACSSNDFAINTVDKKQSPNMNHEGHTENTSALMIKDISESPRHQEWVEIDNNGKIIHAFVVYPESKEKTPALLMIHENKGLNDWAKSMADQVAAEGYIVVAPDLLSSFDAERKKTSDFASPEDATQALYSLSQKSIDSDLEAVSKYVKSLASYNGNLVSAGFCWGGSQSFNLAAQSDTLKASLVFYGTAPEDVSIYSQIDVPVYAFYGENDERVNATIEDTKKYMSENNKKFEYEIYAGAGHAFMRNAETQGADEATIDAREKAFDRMKMILTTYK